MIPGFLGIWLLSGISICCILAASSSSFFMASCSRLSLKSLMFSIATMMILENVWMKLRCFSTGLIPSPSSSISPINTNARWTLLLNTGMIMSTPSKPISAASKKISLISSNLDSTSMFSSSSGKPPFRIHSQVLDRL